MTAIVGRSSGLYGDLSRASGGWGGGGGGLGNGCDWLWEVPDDSVSGTTSPLGVAGCACFGLGFDGGGLSGRGGSKVSKASWESFGTCSGASGGGRGASSCNGSVIIRSKSSSRALAPGERSGLRGRALRGTWGMDICVGGKVEAGSSTVSHCNNRGLPKEGTSSPG